MSVGPHLGCGGRNTERGWENPQGCSDLKLGLQAIGKLEPQDISTLLEPLGSNSQPHNQGLAFQNESVMLRFSGK